MIARTFVDTNVLLYAYDADAGEKHFRAAELLRSLWLEGTGCLSTQVLQEFYVNATKKIRTPVPKAIAREIIGSFGTWVHTAITPGTVYRASEISEAYQLSFWDGLILAAADQEGASVLLSEDLNNGQIISGIRVVNPFVVPV